MDVRLARPTDAPLVLALTLDEHAHLVRSPDWPAARSPLFSLARSVLPFTSRGRTWLAREGNNVALLQARPRRYVIGWDVTRLAVRGDQDLVLGPVIEAVSRHLQGHGVPRLFARCQDDARGPLETMGFRALAREYVLVGEADQRGDANALPADGRYRMPQDAWPLHQLESEVTPPLVRQLEGLTSLDWSQGAKGIMEIVVELDGRVAGWIGWGPTEVSGTLRVGLLVDPGHRELACALLRHVLDQASPGTQFVTRVRDYQPESLHSFTDAGFRIVAEEILMVLHGRLELAWAEPKVRAARVPSIQAFPFSAGIAGPRVAPTAVPSGRRLLPCGPRKEDQT